MQKCNRPVSLWPNLNSADQLGDADLYLGIAMSNDDCDALASHARNRLQTDCDDRCQDSGRHFAFVAHAGADRLSRASPRCIGGGRHRNDREYFRTRPERVGRSQTLGMRALPRHAAASLAPHEMPRQFGRAPVFRRSADPSGRWRSETVDSGSALSETRCDNPPSHVGAGLASVVLSPRSLAVRRERLSEILGPCMRRD